MPDVKQLDNKRKRGFKSDVLDLLNNALEECERQTPTTCRLHHYQATACIVIIIGLSNNPPINPHQTRLHIKSLEMLQKIPHKILITFFLCNFSLSMSLDFSTLIIAFSK